MKVKIKGLVLSLVLIVCGVLGFTTLTACGSVDLKTLNESFLALENIYKANPSVINTTNSSDKYRIYYSENEEITKLIENNTPEYGELDFLYNKMFKSANDYIDKNKSYIMEDKDIANDVKATFKDLNESLEKCVDAVKDFIKERKSFMDFFTINKEETNKAFLRKFKKVYGKMINASIEVSNNLAISVEKKIIPVLKVTTPIENDSKIIKEYIGTKLLPVYSEFMITEIENQFNWNLTAETETKTRLNNLINKLKTNYEEYKYIFENKVNNYKVLTSDEVISVFERFDNYAVEMNSYLGALKDLDIRKLAVDYNNDLKLYKNANKFAEIHILKLEQFVEVTLPKYMESVKNELFI